MSRILAQNRKRVAFTDEYKTVIDTFEADGWTKSGTGTTGTWAIDSSDTYNGRSTLKLVTAGAGTGSRDYAIKALSSPIRIDDGYHCVFELIAKANDINGISRLYLDLYVGSTPYYEIQFESTGNKWGMNNEYEVYRGIIHCWMIGTLPGAYVKQIRLQVSDSGKPITVKFAELSFYKMTKRAYICFTNDDGNKSAYNFYHSVLKPLGIKGTLFPSYENVVSGQGGNANYMNHSDILQLESDGFEIGIHGTNGAVSKTSTTISFDSASNEIRDSGNGFITAGFVAGQFVLVTGSSKNNGKYTIVNVSSGAIVVLETILDESAGSSISLDSSGFSEYSGAGALRSYIDTQKSYFRNTVGVSSLLDTCAYPGGEHGKDSNSYPYVVAKEKFSSCRVTTQNTEPLIHVDPYRINAGRGMYLSSAWTEAQIIAAIANLIFTGGVGIVVSHDIKEAASDSYNYNLTSATTIANYIKARIDAGQLIPIKFNEIMSLQP